MSIATSESIADRLLLAFPSGSYCLPALLRLLEIVESTEVPTACVQCTARPKLYINPEFVRLHADTPEKLMMLVMHELHHVILGHTRLHPRVTRLDNLVFDAVINAMLCQLFPIPEYISMFTDFYREDRFPECFLRPADGWLESRANPPIPSALQTVDHGQCAQLHRALYSNRGVAYSELRTAIEDEVDPQAIDLDTLLGDHEKESQDASSAGNLEQRSPVLLAELRRIVERWPRPPEPIRGRSPHDLLADTQVKPPVSNRTRLEQLLLRVGHVSNSGSIRRKTLAPVDVMSPVPVLDRRATVLTALGRPPALYRHSLTAVRRNPVGHKVHVYLDVSGSIGQLVGPLYAAVLGCREFVHPRVHLFSTKIADVTLSQLRRGVCRTTGGTNISCVAEHIRTHRIKRAALITDGYVGAPGAIDHDTLSRTVLGVALITNTNTRGDLESVANHWIELTEVK